MAMLYSEGAQFIVTMLSPISIQLKKENLHIMHVVHVLLLLLLLLDFKMTYGSALKLFIHILLLSLPYIVLTQLFIAEIPPVHTPISATTIITFVFILKRERHDWVNWKN